MKFKTPNQDFSLIMKQQDFAEISIQGDTMTIPTIKLDEKSTFNDLDKIKLNVSLSEIIIGVNKFNNPIIDFKKDENEFSNLNVRLDGEKDYHKINIEDVGDKKKFFLETNFAPGLFNIFDIDLKINTGSLKIEGEKMNNSKTFKGNIAGKDFVFLDAPFLANFITLFSLQGLAQKLKDGGIILKALRENTNFQMIN